MSPSPYSLNLISAGILFGILQITFLLFLILAKRNSTGLRYIALFLLVLLFAQVETFLNRSGLMAKTLYLLNTATPMILLLGPFAFLYIKSLLGESVSLKKTWHHYAPFLLYFCYSFFFFVQPEAYKYNAFVNSFHPSLEKMVVHQAFDADPLNIQGIVVVELLAAHILFYSILIFKRIRKEFAPRKLATGLPLLLNYLLAMGGIILYLSQGGVVNGFRFMPSLIPAYSADLYPAFATYILSFYLFVVGFHKKSSQPKYYKSSLSKELMSRQMNDILAIMENQRLFVQPGFSLQLLADSCQISAHHLSQVINEEMGCTFFELTNEYRIREAKRILAKEEDTVKMEQLAYELGYKSKSTFFIAFKKATKLTPHKYRQMNAN